MELLLFEPKRHVLLAAPVPTFKVDATSSFATFTPAKGLGQWRLWRTPGRPQWHWGCPAPTAPRRWRPNWPSPG